MQAAERSTFELEAEIEGLKQEIATMKENAASSAVSLLERSRHAARAVKDSIASGVRRGWDGTQTRIQERPMTAVLIALGVGVGVGALAGGLIVRRRR